MAFPIAIVLAVLTQLSVPFRVHPSIVALYAIVFTYAVISVPFVIGGIAVCLALTGFPSRVSRLYGADLTGAAVGCVALIPVLGYSDAPTAVLWIAAIASLGGVAFARDAGSSRLRTAAMLVLVVTGVSAAAHTILVWKEFPVFRILYIKGTFEARPLYEKWNSYSRVRVNGDERQVTRPTGWGLSPTLPDSLRVRQLQMDIDVIAGTVMTGFDGNVQSLQHLKYDLTNIAYYLRPDARVLVVGAGGGRDVLAALAFGARSVVAVEINEDVLRTVNGRFGAFTGHLDRDPRVTFVNDEARGFTARTTDRFDLIQISLIDTWAATAAGAFVLSENSIYTVEAWTTFLSRLSDRGVLTVSRWYFRDRPAEVYRTTTLAVEALSRLGVSDPRAHIAIVRTMRVANRPEAPDGVGTLLVSRQPFTPGDLANLDRVSSDLGFDVVFGPRAASDQVFERLMTERAGSDYLAAFPVNIEAPTDDSPFFFNMLRLRDVFKWELLEVGKQSHNMKAVATLAALLGATTVMTVLCILLPLSVAGRRTDLSGTLPLLTFFVAIGLGFMLIETSQMQRLIISLGHPTYGLSVVLFALLLSSGAGSFLTASVASEHSGATGVRRLVALVAVLAIVGMFTPSVVRWTESAITSLRIAAAIAVLAPAGVVMGMAFPLGMKLAARRAPALTPWMWGLNGAASVLASVVGVCLSLTWSISAAFWAGWVCYVVALAAFSLARTPRGLNSGIRRDLAREHVISDVGPRSGVARVSIGEVV